LALRQLVVSSVLAPLASRNRATRGKEVAAAGRYSAAGIAGKTHAVARPDDTIVGDGPLAARPAAIVVKVGVDDMVCIACTLFRVSAGGSLRRGISSAVMARKK
jgi:hypothetical protein